MGIRDVLPENAGYQRGPSTQREMTSAVGSKRGSRQQGEEGPGSHSSVTKETFPNERDRVIRHKGMQTPAKGARCWSYTRANHTGGTGGTLGRS